MPLLCNLFPIPFRLTSLRKFPLLFFPPVPPFLITAYLLPLSFPPSSFLPATISLAVPPLYISFLPPSFPSPISAPFLSSFLPFICHSHLYHLSPPILSLTPSFSASPFLHVPHYYFFLSPFPSSLTIPSFFLALPCLSYSFSLFSPHLLHSFISLAITCFSISAVPRPPHSLQSFTSLPK